jgi:hypothetical protein
MSIKRLLIILVDISGYTNFIRLHKMSLLHAEKIIGELMESILDEVELPVISHEILGDAISLYALDDGSPDLADNIYLQLKNYFMAFHKREANLLRECGYCICEACNNVGKLKIKAIVHSGEAAFTMVRDMQKISGEDVITTHRLLKNSIKSDEYIGRAGGAKSTKVSSSSTSSKCDSPSWAEQATMAVSPRCIWSAINRTSFSNQGQRFSSVRGSPPAILATFSGG